MSLYERVAATPEGARALAKSRLRRELNKVLLDASRGRTMFDADLSWRDRWRIRRRLASWPRSVEALAEYLHAYGYELEVVLVPAGQPRQEVLERRAKAATRPVPWTGGDGNVWDADAYTDRDGKAWRFWGNHSAHPDLLASPWYSTRGEAPAAIQYLVAHRAPLVSTDKD